MHSVSISLAKPGQVLAQPVTNPGGAVLCPAGYALTEAALDRLRNAGVETVLLEGEAEGPSLAERLEALNRRFEGIEDPILLQIKAAIENFMNPA